MSQHSGENELSFDSMRSFFLNGHVCTLCSHQEHHPASKYSAQSISHLSMTKAYSEEHSEGECEQHSYCCYSQGRVKQKKVGPRNQYSTYFFLVRNTEHIEQNIFIFTYTQMCIYILQSDLSCSPRKAQQNILLATIIKIEVIIKICSEPVYDRNCLGSTAESNIFSEYKR